MVSANFGKFLPRAGRGDGLPLINRVSSAVRYIHYLAPAAHLFAARRLSILAAAPLPPPRVLAPARGINQRFLKTRPAGDGVGGGGGGPRTLFLRSRREIATAAICHPTLPLSLSLFLMQASASTRSRVLVV